MTTTKLSFRARALDAAKPMAVFMAHELPDLPDFTIINRAVPQMPTGMEKEEETEHHLQRAIVTGLIIPTPEVFQVDEVGGCYNRCYPGEWKVPRNLIHMQPFTMEQDIPDYDMDSDDEKWINSQAAKLEITPLQFEEMMDRLEKSSGQTVITLNEAKSLLKQDDDFIVAVYDYWLNKRLKMLNPLIPQVKTEKFGGTGSSGNPYIAFRRRTEKMQTRKHRKNDEASYEKMLKLRRDLSRALTVLDMVKKRENCKRDIVVCGIEVYEKRYALSDYSGHIINEVNAQVKQQPRPSYTPLSTIQSSNVWPNSIPQMIGTLQTNRGRAFKDDLRKERRHYRRRRIKSTSTKSGFVSPGLSTLNPTGNPAVSSRGLNFLSDAQSASSEEEIEGTMGAFQSDLDDMESELDKQGPFGFRRKINCNYLAPTQVSSSNSCHDPDDSGLVDPRHRYFLTSLTSPKSHCLGFVRRRFGRGGRVVLDRSYSQRDGKSSFLNDLSNCHVLTDELKEEILQLRHFKPITEARTTDVESNDSSSNVTEGSDAPGFVTICPDGNEEDCQTYDPHSVMDNVFLDGCLDGFRMPSSKCFSPPSVTNSCVSVIGDTSPSLEKVDLDWWNYFEPVSEVDNITKEVNSYEDGKKIQLNPHLNGINSSPTLNDSPPWKVSKSASLPSNDCSMVNPCLGELHTSEEKDQNNQTVVDFLLIDSTFAMEVT